MPAYDIGASTCEHEVPNVHVPEKFTSAPNIHKLTFISIRHRFKLNIIKWPLLPLSQSQNSTIRHSLRAEATDAFVVT